MKCEEEEKTKKECVRDVEGRYENVEWGRRLGFLFMAIPVVQ